MHLILIFRFKCMEPLATAVEAHRDNDDAVFVSCVAMFALLIVFVTTFFATPLFLRTMIPPEMLKQNTASLTQSQVSEPVFIAPQTIEQELDSIGLLLDSQTPSASPTTNPKAKK